MNIRILSFTVFSFQFNLNNIEGVDINNKTPIIITSIDKITKIFINFFYILFLTFKSTILYLFIDNYI